MTWLSSSLLESLCWFPVLFRFLYVQRMIFVVKAFSLDSREQLARARQRRSIHCLIVTLVSFAAFGCFYSLAEIIFEPPPLLPLRPLR